MALDNAIPLAQLVRFASPWWWLVAVAAAAPIAAAALARRRGRRIAPLLVAVQCAAAVLAAGALAKPTAPIGRRAKRPYLLLRDVSASCRGQSTPQPDLPEDLPCEAYDFAAAVTPRGGRPDPNETRLAGALQLAVARRADLPGVIVRTDGRFTDADWPAAADAVGRAQLPVFLVPMESPPADAHVAAFSARRQSGGAVRLHVTVRTNALQRRTMTIRRLRPPRTQPLLIRRLDLLADEPAAVSLGDTVPPDAAAAYLAELSAGDAFPENDSAEAVVLPARRRLAVIDDGALPAADLAAAAGCPVERLAAAPSSGAGWMDYAAIVLVDAEGTRLPPKARAALAEFVRAGGGLVLVGAGPHASPADRDDPLNRVAALRANPYQRTPLHVTVVLDASGSMRGPARSGAGRIKFDQAVEAVLSLRRHLTDADALSVITFSDRARGVYDSGAGRVDFAELREALGRAAPAGPTDVMPALEKATERPPGRGRDGLVLVVSDLITTRDFRPDRAAARFRRHELSLAVVVVRSGTEQPGRTPPLETLAKLLNAPLIERESLADLAGIFARFLRDARGEAVRRGRFAAAAVRAPFGLPPGPLPEVQAYLLCAPQPGGEVYARVGTEGDPLLAARRAGLGRSVSLALPIRGGANPAWRQSGQLVRWVGAAARWALRPSGDPRFTGGVRRALGTLRIRLDAADADGPMNLLDLTAEIAVPGGPAQPQSFALRQTAPGRYEADLPSPSGAAALAVRLRGGQVVWRAAMGRAAPRELAAIGADWGALRDLARRTGGRICHEGDLAELGQRLSARGRTDLWPVLLAAAAALMLLEWALARVQRQGV